MSCPHHHLLHPTLSSSEKGAGLCIELCQQSCNQKSQCRVHAPPIYGSIIRQLIHLCNGTTILLLGSDATAPGAQSFLCGPHPPDVILNLLQPETTLMLKEMTKPRQQQAKSINITITPEFFIECYNTVQERISLSPSGRHFDHYKAFTNGEILTFYTCGNDVHTLQGWFLTKMI
jgi:hypothetical protein